MRVSIGEMLMSRNKRVESSRAVGRAHFHHAQFAIATAYARMGRKDETVRWLDRAASNGMPA